MAKRPRAVWIVCLGNGVLAVFLIAASLIAESRGFRPWQAAISGISGFGISLAAHASWFGYKLGRAALLALVSLYLGLVVVQDMAVLIWSVQTGYEGPPVQAAFTRVLLSLLWLAVNYVVLLNKQSRSFFG